MFSDMLFSEADYETHNSAFLVHLFLSYFTSTLQQLFMGFYSILRSSFQLLRLISRVLQVSDF